MYRAYKFRLYPTTEQKTKIHKNFGCGRFIFNYYLNDIKENGYKNAYSCIKDYTSKLKYEYSFLQEVDSIIIRKELFFLENSLKRFYNSGFGYPKFKSKFDKNSYTTNAIYNNYKDKHYCNIEVDLENKEILSKTKIEELLYLARNDKIDQISENQEEFKKLFEEQPKLEKPKTLVKVKRKKKN